MSPPDSGLAFVIVVHLAPEHKSHLADLLQTAANLPVQQVTETTALEANHAYVIPPNANLNAVDTHLRLSSLEPQRSKRAPIDHFFRTMAQTHDGHSVGVILTGTGSDGTLGIKDVKAKGGIIIVQDPNEAEYDGMPQSAIATGLADLVLPIQEIPAAILRFDRTAPRVPRYEDAVETNNSEEPTLQKVFFHLRSRADRDFSRYKRSTVVRRIARRMQLSNIEDLQTYLGKLRDHPEETRALADDLLVTVTNFFRDAAVYEKLERDVIPRLFDSKEANKSVRVWSVGCATGEEAYSLAMLLVEEAGHREVSPQLQVFASDLHRGSLQKARDGFYPGDIETDVSAERLKRFFVRESMGFRIKKELRDLVVFAPHNLLGDPPFSRLDLISCRNLLIYLQRDVQREVTSLFHYALNPDGTLMLGSAETVDASDLFRAEDKKLCLYRKRNIPAPEPRLPVFPLSRAIDHRADGVAISESRESISSGTMHQRMVEMYAPPSILVSSDNKLVHLSRHAGKYLLYPGGEPTANIFKLIREELRIELQALLQKAREKRESCDSMLISVTFEGVCRSVVMHVGPANEPEQDGFALIIFEERERQKTAVDSGSATDTEAGEEEIRVSELHDKLAVSHERFRSVIEEYETSQEEMRASNEEMQSTNEELRSTMEELETSKEELQSINEELQTVNQENRHKVEELAQLSGDLHNLLSATAIATLFLDRNLRIQRFTPKVAELFNVRTTDRGRPISDLTHRLGYPHLQSDAQAVLKDLSPIEREVRDDGNQWYLTRVLPYRSADDRIEGIVITFVDITRRIKAEAGLRESQVRLSAELSAMQHLHTLVNRLLISPNLEKALQSVLESVSEITSAGFGNIQLLDPQSGALMMTAQLGLTDDSIAHFEEVASHSESACGRALRLGERVLVQDIATDPLYKQYREAAEKIGYRSVQATPLVSRNGRVLGVLSTHSVKPYLPTDSELRILDLYTRQATDFVERSQAQERLRQSEERYRLLIENAREYAILMINPAGQVATWSAGAERIFGYSEKEVVGHSASMLFTADDQLKGIPEQEMQAASKDGRASYDRWLQRKDGSHFWAIGVMEVVSSANQEPLGFVKVLRDDSERKSNEEKLREKEQSLSRANEALSHANTNLKQFAFAASHDLREPLRTISAYTKILVDAGKQGRDTDASKAAEFLLQGTNRMEKLLSDLLSYTQLTVEEENDSEVVELNLVVEKTLESLSNQVQQSGAVVKRGNLPAVLGHETLYIQLFQNLISNAVKYRSERPLEIRITAEREADRWQFTLADNGIGIDAAYHEQIFGVFKRLHGSKIPGTGIGLAICKQVVERSGGQIWVESQPGDGATFRWTIPVLEEAAITGMPFKLADC